MGLPIKWLGEQGEDFRKYLLRSKEVTFRCNDTRYHVKIEDVEVYVQRFAAVAADLPSYQGFNIVADIEEKYLKAIGECAADYTNKIMRKLREYGYNEELAKFHFLGGGAILMKHFAKLNQNKVRFIEQKKPVSQQLQKADKTEEDVGVKSHILFELREI